MNVILFIGIQASGKSTFYKSRYVDSHIRINLDMLKTRHRERRLIECCLDIQQPFVIDNTNLTRKDRQRYLHLLEKRSVGCIGYYFETTLKAALQRNAQREQPIPKKGVVGAFRRLEPPRLEEGFSELYTLKLAAEGFEVVSFIGTNTANK